MSLDHKNVVRNNDEYFCTACGKSWEASDRDPPQCVEPSHFATGGYVREMPDELGEHMVFLTPRSVGKSMTFEQAQKCAEEWRKNNPEVTRLWQTPTDPNRLLERMLVERASTQPLTRDDFATVTAWLVSEVDDHRRAMLVYAPDRHTAQQYAVAVTGRTATMEVRRLGAMDNHGWGRSAYVELNPALLKKASNAAGREVVSLITWRREA